MNNELRTCTICKLDKPFPSDFITSFKKLRTVGQCKECRAHQRKQTRIKTLGKTDKNYRFNKGDDISKFFKIIPK